MSELRFTPGPWIRDRFGCLRGSDGEPVLIADSGIGTASGFERPTLVANTKLIHAAPDLFAALREMVELREKTQQGQITEKHELDIVRDAKAAIARATGAEA